MIFDNRLKPLLYLLGTKRFNLAAVLTDEGMLLTFDGDFASLGLKSSDGGLWTAA